jgi:hypothetical protein
MRTFQTKVMLLSIWGSIMKEKHFLCFVSVYTGVKHVFYNSARLADSKYRIIPLYPTIYSPQQVNWCGKILSGPLSLP